MKFLFWLFPVLGEAEKICELAHDREGEKQ